VVMKSVFEIVVKLFCGFDTYILSKECFIIPVGQLY
jgi:hypothetical protein